MFDFVHLGVFREVPRPAFERDQRESKVKELKKISQKFNSSTTEN
jgi:hypothetical protein